MAVLLGVEVFQGTLSRCPPGQNCLLPTADVYSWIWSVRSSLVPKGRLVGVLDGSLEVPKNLELRVSDCVSPEEPQGHSSLGDGSRRCVLVDFHQTEAQVGPGSPAAQCPADSCQDTCTPASSPEHTISKLINRCSNLIERTYSRCWTKIIIFLYRILSYFVNCSSLLTCRCII